MSTIYHNKSSNFNIPNNWVKNEEFEACFVNEHNTPWNEIVDQGTKYRLILKYEEQYGILARILRVALGTMLSFSLLCLFFKSGRHLVEDLIFNSVKDVHMIREEKDILELEMVEVYVSMAGNPAHMGHMHMIALVVNRLVKEGYQIGKVKVALGTDQYLMQKVHYCNESIKKHNELPEEKPEMLRVLLPRMKRIEFLKAAIMQAKNDKIFDTSLDIDYFDDSKKPLHGGRKVFQACGDDFAADLGDVKHAVIVTREGNDSLGIIETHTNDYSRLIVKNHNKTSSYSSSKIQNGAYDLLPEAIRDEFKKMHQEAQGKKAGITGYLV